MLIADDVLRLCLRDAGVEPARSTLVHVGAYLATEHERWAGLGFARIVHIDVSATSLADLLSQHAVVPDVLVIDVQGVEMDVLRGLGDAWNSVRVLLVGYQRGSLHQGSPSFAQLETTVTENGLVRDTVQDDVSSPWSTAAFIRRSSPRYRRRRRRQQLDLLSVPYRNAYSQFGEDGLLREACRQLRIDSGVLVEIGAWDGIHLSNCRVLMEAGWHGYLVEADVGRIDDLIETTAHMPRARPINATVGPAGEPLTRVLDAAACPAHIDVLSIDIDSDDLAVFEDFASTRTASVVCIEYNPTIPPDLSVRNRPGRATGNSFNLIAEVGESLGYDLVAWTKVNQILVHRNFSGAFASHPRWVPPRPIGHSRMLWGYDGTLYDYTLDAQAPIVPDEGKDIEPLWGQGRFAQPVPVHLRAYPPPFNDSVSED